MYVKTWCTIANDLVILYRDRSMGRSVYETLTYLVFIMISSHFRCIFEVPKASSLFAEMWLCTNMGSTTVDGCTMDELRNIKGQIIVFLNTRSRYSHISELQV